MCHIGMPTPIVQQQTWMIVMTKGVLPVVQVNLASALQLAPNSGRLRAHHQHFIGKPHA